MAHPLDPLVAIGIHPVDEPEFPAPHAPLARELASQDATRQPLSTHLIQDFEEGWLMFRREAVEVAAGATRQVNGRHRRTRVPASVP